MNHFSLAATTLFAALVIAGQPQAAVIDATRGEIHAQTKAHGSNINTGSADGENWQFNGVTGNNTFDGGTSFSAMTFDATLRGGTDVTWQTGFGRNPPFLTFSSARGIPFGSQLQAISGYETAAVSGNLSFCCTTASSGGYLDRGWAAVAYDLSASSLNIVSSGGFRNTSDGTNLLFSNLTGSGTTVSGTTAMDAGDRLGVFSWTTAQNNLGGNHFNLSDAGIVSTLENVEASVVVPASCSSA